MITARASTWPGRCLAWGLAFLANAPASAEVSIAGADVSHLEFFEERGVVYRDEQGVRDALAILSGQGLNCARLRLFTSSAEQAGADPYNAINNLDYTVPLAVRVKNAGMRFLLDIHYSDSWADPGKQDKPVEWVALAFPELEERVFEYSRGVTEAFRKAGAAPDYVQVGNEVTGGLLWPDGRVGGSYDTAGQWSQLGRLLKSAIRGLKEGAGDSPPDIMIHIDRGADWGTTRWFFDRLMQEQVAFDLIGQSYYPFWHGSLNDVRTCLNQGAVRYGKPVWIVETAFPWSGSVDVAGISPSPAGQVEYVLELARTLRGVPGGKGMGIVWWGAEYVRLGGYSLAGFDRRSFFDFEGCVLPVAGVLGQLTWPVRLDLERSSTGLALTWPASGVGMVLTTTSTASLPRAWTTVDTVPVWDGVMFRASLPYTDPFGLFRLESQ